MRIEADGGVGELLDIIRDEIRANGPITFARFMELALYHPSYGYYASDGASRIGTGGDYFTASDVGPAFGICLARQIAEIDRTIGPLDPFHVVEFGAGRGLLARDILDAMPAVNGDLARRLRYRMVERSAAMRETAARRVPEARVVAPGCPARKLSGCVLAVELFDALPVHRVRRRGKGLVEVRVGIDAASRLVEVEQAAASPVADWAERYGAAAEEGTEAEVGLSAGEELDLLQRSIGAGVFLLVDYGRPATELYGPDRPRGTMLAYRGHATSEAYLGRVGRQDLTAHVNFTALEDRARELGLSVLGLTTQDRFLIANGILDEFEQPDLRHAHDPRRVKRRLQAKQLIHPSGMGRTFRVLALSKGCAPDLAGLHDPFS